MSKEAEWLRSVLVHIGLSQHLTVVEEMGRVLLLPLTPEGHEWMRENRDMLIKYGAKLLVEQ
jgi:hypothetical protein